MLQYTLLATALTAIRIRQPLREKEGFRQRESDPGSGKFDVYRSLPEKRNDPAAAGPSP